MSGQRPTHAEQGFPEAETAPQPLKLLEIAVLVSFGAAVLSLLIFGWIAEEMLHGHTVHFDMAGRAWVHQFAAPTMTQAMIAISLLGNQILLLELAVAAAIFLYVGWRRAAAWLVIAVLGAEVLEVVLKHAFHRPRPEPFFVASPHSFSFPSGHALLSFCFYGVLAGLLADRITSLAFRITLWTAAAVLVAAIGFSRIYLGVHYPSDVIAGYLAGAVWVGSVIVLDHVRRVRRSTRSAT